LELGNLNPHRDWSKQRTNEFNISVFCDGCRGTGLQRKRSSNGITWSPIRCRKCRGLKRIFTYKGSETWKKCSQIIQGLWEWDKVHNRVHIK